MYKSGLVPRRMALLGLIGGPLALVTATAVLFGAWEQLSGVSFLFTLAEIAWELSLTIGVPVGQIDQRRLLRAGMHQCQTPNPNSITARGRRQLPPSAPSAGTPPWHLYRLTFHTVFGVATAEPNGATRWRFGS